MAGTVKVVSSDEGKIKGAKNVASSMFILYLDSNSLVKASSNPTESDSSTDTSSFSKDYIHFSQKDLNGIRTVTEYGGNNVRVYNAFYLSYCRFSDFLYMLPPNSIIGQFLVPSHLWTQSRESWTDTRPTWREKSVRGKQREAYDDSRRPARSCGIN